MSSHGACHHIRHVQAEQLDETQMAAHLGQPFSFVAEAEGAVLGAVVASLSQPASAESRHATIKLLCLAVNPELEERAGILTCLLHFFLQYLQAHTSVSALLEGASRSKDRAWSKCLPRRLVLVPEHKSSDA